MYHVIKQLHFCYGHRLLEYTGKCKHPHGHNGRVEIEFSSPTLDAKGMVIDFVDIKRVVKEFLDREFDHKMLLREDDPLAKILREMGEPVVPFKENPTAENIAKRIFQYVEQQGLPIRRVRLWETEDSCAEYMEA